MNSVRALLHEVGGVDDGDVLQIGDKIIFIFNGFFGFKYFWLQNSNFKRSLKIQI